MESRHMNRAKTSGRHLTAVDEAVGVRDGLVTVTVLHRDLSPSHLEWDGIGCYSGKEAAWEG